MTWRTDSNQATRVRGEHDGSREIDHRGAGPPTDRAGADHSPPYSHVPVTEHRGQRVSFTKPNLPVIDLAEWRAEPRGARIRPLVEHYARHGFGAPTALPLLYGVKIILYVLGAAVCAASTAGSGGLGKIGEWWSDPITFQKIVLFTILFEVLGLGCGFGPLNSRVLPPMGSPLYWLRPGTIRLAPWPTRVPLTSGDRRTWCDAVLYATLLAALFVGLFSDGTVRYGTPLLPVWIVVWILVVTVVLGLRDRVIFLAARGEVYIPMTVMFLWSASDVVVGAELMFLLIWVGAATSKLNRHFPFVIAAMMANSPAIRPSSLKTRFFRNYPVDLRPGRLAKQVAHVSTVIELAVPFVLFFSDSGPVLYVAAAAMIVFHLGILTAIPMGVPLEWNVFMMYGVLALFVANRQYTVADLTHPVPVLFVVAAMILIVVVGSAFPRKVNFLFGMRYYAGNWDTTLWLMTSAARAKLERSIICVPAIPPRYAHVMHGEDGPEVPQHMGYAFRAMNTHGRALFTLANRAIDGSRSDEYDITDGEMVASLAVGWNFGDGHFTDERLVAALQKRAHFEPGEVRIVMLDAQPIHQQTQRYRLVDAATGEFEHGVVRVADMVDRQPWDDTVPVHVVSHRHPTPPSA